MADGSDRLSNLCVTEHVFKELGQIHWQSLNTETDNNLLITC